MSKNNNDNSARIITEIKTNAEILESYFNGPGSKQWDLDQNALKLGLDLSRRVCQQPQYVVPTPLSKNLLEALGDIEVKTESDKATPNNRLTISKAGKTQADKGLQDVVLKLLKRFNGDSVSEYDPTGGAGSIRNYHTDCGTNGKPYIGDIKAGQAKEREETFKKFVTPLDSITVSDIMNDPDMCGSLSTNLNLIPKNVRALPPSHDLVKVFGNKNSGVSYPFYKNDRTIYQGNKTYGDLCMDIAAKTPLSEALKYNIYTAYPRNSRGKGRGLEAQSYILNAIINRVNSDEINKYKELFRGTPFTDFDTMKRRLTKLLKLCEVNHCTAHNRDITGYDASISRGFVVVNNALRMTNASKDAVTREIIKIRTASMLKAPFVNGPAGKVQTIYGRTMSGSDDTTLQNTTITSIVARAAIRNATANSSLFKDVIKSSNDEGDLYLGDDILQVGVPMEKNAYITFAKRFDKYGSDGGFTLHDFSKDALGIMFLQYRLFYGEDGELHMAYPGTRVFRSMLSKEETRGLGEYGGTLAFGSQIDKVADYKPALTILVNLAASLDKARLHIFTPISQIIDGVKREDAEALSKLSSVSQRNKFRTTAERVLVNPHANRLGGESVNSSKVRFDNSRLSYLQKLMQEVYDENWLTKTLGIPNPVAANSTVSKKK